MSHLETFTPRGVRRHGLVAAALLIAGCTFTTTNKQPARSEPPAAAVPSAAPEPAEREPTAKADKPKRKKAKRKKPKSKPAEQAQAPAPAAPEPPAANPEPAEPAPAAQPEQSHIVLPVRVALDALREQIEKVLPKEERRDWTRVTKDDASPRADVKATIWRDAVQVTFSDEAFHITVPVRYAANVRAQLKNPLDKDGWTWIAKNESWGTKEEPQRLSATFHLKLGVDEQWRVKSDLRLGELKHGPAPSGKICKNAGIQVCVERESLAPRVNDGIDDYIRPKLEKALGKVERKIEKAFDLRGRADAVWTELQQPRAVRLPGISEPQSLVMQPVAAGIGKPQLDGSDVRIDLSIAGRIAIGDPDELTGRGKPAPTPLPNVSEVREPAGFHVIAALDLPYDALGASLTRELRGAAVGKDKQLSITGVKVVARVNLQRPRGLGLLLSLGGAVQDTLELSGELVYDAAAQRLSVANLSYTASAEVEKKLAAFDPDKIRKQIEAKAQWNLAAEAAAFRKGVEAALRDAWRSQVNVTGSLDAIDVRDFALTNRAVLASVIVGGELQVGVGSRAGQP